MIMIFNKSDEFIKEVISYVKFPFDREAIKKNYKIISKIKWNIK